MLQDHLLAVGAISSLCESSNYWWTHSAWLAHNASAQRWAKWIAGHSVFLVSIYIWKWWHITVTCTIGSKLTTFWLPSHVFIHYATPLFSIKQGIMYGYIEVPSSGQRLCTSYETHPSAISSFRSNDLTDLVLIWLLAPKIELIAYISWTC